MFQFHYVLREFINESVIGFDFKTLSHRRVYNKNPKKENKNQFGQKSI